MKEYIVCCWQPLSDDNSVTTFAANTLAQAKEIANEKRMDFHDVIIISKQKVTNAKTKEVEDKYTIEKFGYYRIYRLINFILSMFLLASFALIVYLYYKLVKK